MGSSSKNAREVYDYLISIDYGVCHGPVDSVNQIWIKDKPIFCGMVTERSDISVNLPDLFGGDEGEGGPVGVVEVYIGDDYQLASADLAGRVGRTVATMPGYRGLTHLFFRGGAAQEVIGAEDGSGGVGGLIRLFRDAVLPEPTVSYTGQLEPYRGIREDSTGSIVNMGAVFPDPDAGIIARSSPTVIEDYSESVGPVTDYGFRWTSNNPYLPAAKVNVTRCPFGRSGAFRFIWPMGTEDIFTQIFLDQSLGILWFIDEDDTFVQEAVYSDLVIPIVYGENTLRPRYEWDFTIVRSPTGVPGTQIDVVVRFFGDGPAPGEVGAVLIRDDTFQVDPGTISFTPVPVVGFSEVPEGTRFIEFYVIVFGTGVDLEIAGTSQYVQQELRPTDDSSGIGGGGGIGAGGGGGLVIPRYIGQVREWGVNPVSGGAIDGIDLETGNLSAVFMTYVEMGGLPEEISVILEAEFHGEGLVIGEDGAIVEGDFVGSLTGGATETGFGVASINGPIPAGTRFILMRAAVAAFIPLFSDFKFGVARGTASFGMDLNAPGGGGNGGGRHCNVDGTLGPLPDANPSHMLYELMTNEDWGMGEDPAFMGNSFPVVARTLYDESFGLSMRWTAETEIEKFAQEIIDHISAVLFPDPVSGLWELKLLRGDYETEGLDVLNPSNCTLEDRKRRTWGETINYITVSYTDPKVEKDATVNADDAGNIAMQGVVVRDTRNYYGIRNEALAQTVANRDVRAAAYPLYSATAKVDRTQWQTKPGDVKKLSWPEDGIEEMIVRVMAVDYGSPTDRHIKLSLVEDVFALDATTYTDPQPGLWTPEATAPENMEYQMAVTVPLPFLTQNGLDVEDIDAEYPETYVAFLGYNPTPRVINFDAYERLDDGAEYRELGRMDPVRAAFLTTALEPEVQSSISQSLISSIMRGSQEAGDSFLIGTDERTAEIVQLDRMESGAWVIHRGVYDTVPRVWPVGTIVWAFPNTDTRVSSRLYSPYDDPDELGYDFRLAPRMASGRITKENATRVTSFVPARPHLPFRPANCQLEGTGFGPWRVPIEDDIPATVTASWATRNRLNEDSVIAPWDAASITPETDQVVVLRIVDPFGNLELEIPDLTGEAYEIPIADLGPLRNGFVQFYAENANGDRSLMAAQILFDIRQTGYGFSYGFNYGGPGADVDPEDVSVGFGRNYGQSYGE